MRSKLFRMILLLMALPLTLAAQDFINLTPMPSTLVKGTGSLTLTADYKVGYAADLSADMQQEVAKFVAAVNHATGYSGTAAAGATDALITVVYDGTQPDEGYRLTVSATKAEVKAKTPVGLYYAFQTIKKVLPANVMAAVRDAGVTTYAIPAMTVIDKPRFGYRGFMLDVSRHFFSLDDVKRMIDVMSYYKMNKFHWHLSDDQGWRVEIKKYPKLTSVASVAPNCRLTDMDKGQYWINQPYGPYFYTQDQLREVVAYAAERHIDVIPEIDMPGHFTAALVAYPEFSCSPSASRAVWTDGGISADVLNVANPRAVQFAKDILDEIMDIFPSDRIHIGGDECPTSAWQNNAECQKAYADLGLTSYRALQSHFIKQLSDHVTAKGRHIAVWNEAICAEGTDLDIMKQTGATVYCWTYSPSAASACAKAAELKMNNIFTPWGPYYINRKQSTNPGEPAGAGDGTDTVEKTYNTEAAGSNISATALPYYTGVQGTFWTEHVSDRRYMEYLALPRLIAIAEAGWTPSAKKNFADFQKRITADTLLLNYNNYNYGRHYILGAKQETSMVMPKASTAKHAYWYRLVTRATGDRQNNCMELLREGSPIIAAQSGKNAKAGRLWQNAQVEEGDAAYDYQLWAFEEDPANPGRYALVCKAIPAGSVKPQPTSTNTSGRWDYDNTTKHYCFILGEGGYGVTGDGYYYTLRSTSITNTYMNAAASGQGFSVNVYPNPTDGNGGLWLLKPMFTLASDADLTSMLEEINEILPLARTYAGGQALIGAYSKESTDALKALVEGNDPDTMTDEQLAAYAAQVKEAYAAFKASFGRPEAGKTYRISNTVEGFEGIALTDVAGKARLTHGTATFQSDAWRVESTSLADDGTQTLTLSNVATGRYIGSPAASFVSRKGYPVAVASGQHSITAAFNAAEADFTLASEGKALFPVPETADAYAGNVSSGPTIDGGQTLRWQGTGWAFTEVKAITFVCRDKDGNALDTKQRSVPVVTDQPLSAFAPAIPNFSLISLTADEANADRQIAVYERTAYSVTYVLTDASGALIDKQDVSVPVGQSLTVSWPDVPHFRFGTAGVAEGSTLAVVSDTILTATYTTDAYLGASRLAEQVETVEDGKSYIIFDAHSDRYGYRRADPAGLAVRSIRTMDQGIDPYGIWTLEAKGNGFKIKNAYAGKYVPSMTTQAVAPVLSANGETWTISTNSDGSKKIKGQSNGVCWDGLANGNLVGWNDPGHPYHFYTYFAQPYYLVTVQAVDDKNQVLSTESTLVAAGGEYHLYAPTFASYTLSSIEGADGLADIQGHTTVILHYAAPDAIGAISADGRSSRGLYDLSGRRVKAAQKGLYIVDGKKVLVP